MSPTVSIVTATYNRSDVLACAIDSVLRQTVTDWELLVIGDACTDDTAAVVAGYGDPRIRFVNLEKNVGEQSGPNNRGVELSRGDHVAFLNHDDLWLPQHLEAALAGLRETGADMVYTLLDVVKAGAGRWRPNRLPTASPDLRYNPFVQVPASCWLLPRKTLQRVGPWRHYREAHLIPSQDWLYRAWRAGLDLRLVPRLTVLAFPSGKRPGSYLRRDDSEQREMLTRMQQPDFVERELTHIAAGFRMHWLDQQPPGELLRWALRNLAGKIALKFGIHPHTLHYFLKYRRRGGYIDYLRRNRGLEHHDTTT